MEKKNMKYLEELNIGSLQRGQETEREITRHTPCSGETTKQELSTYRNLFTS